MDNRTLGKSGISIQPLGLGCAAIGGYYTRNGRIASRGEVDDRESIRAIHAALDHGVQLFDVANMYGAGHVERLLGDALRDGKREQAILHVKFGASFDEVTKRQIEYEPPLEPQWIHWSLEGSLRRLQTDYIDVFQFQIADYPLEHLGDIIGVLNDLVEQGKIRSYSLGTGDVERATTFAEAPHCADIITNHNVLMDAPEMLNLVEKHGVALLAGIPFYIGLLTGKYSPQTRFPANDLRHQFDFALQRFSDLFGRLDAITDILQSDGRTIAQGALAWIWARHDASIPLPGFKTVLQVEDNAGALAFGPLTYEQMNAIDAILSRYAVAE